MKIALLYLLLFFPFIGFNSISGSPISPSDAIVILTPFLLSIRLRYHQIILILICMFYVFASTYDPQYFFIRRIMPFLYPVVAYNLTDNITSTELMKLLRALTFSCCTASFLFFLFRDGYLNSIKSQDYVILTLLLIYLILCPVKRILSLSLASLFLSLFILHSFNGSRLLSLTAAAALLITIFKSLKSKSITLWSILAGFTLCAFHILPKLEVIYRYRILLGDISDASRLDTVAIRLSSLSEIVSNITSRSLMFGDGGRLYTFYNGANDSIQNTAFLAHNDYIAFVASYGILGFLFFLLLLSQIVPKTQFALQEPINVYGLVLLLGAATVPLALKPVINLGSTAIPFWIYALLGMSLLRYR